MTQPHTTIIIKLEGEQDLSGFECRGRTKRICDGCRLRFLCLTDRDDLLVPKAIVKKHKIKSLASLVGYMFGEGRVNYTLIEHNSFGQNKQVMRINDER